MSKLYNQRASHTWWASHTGWQAACDENMFFIEAYEYSSWSKLDPVHYTGRSTKHIPRTIPDFCKKIEVTTLLSWFLDVFSQVLRIPLLNYVQVV